MTDIRREDAIIAAREVPEEGVTETAADHETIASSHLHQNVEDVRPAAKNHRLHAVRAALCLPSKTHFDKATRRLLLKRL